MELAQASRRPPSLIGAQHLWEMLSQAISAPSGAFIEVGVYRGGSAWYLDQIAQWQERACYLCDTFTGIPFHQEGLDAHHAGDFSDVNIAAVRSLFQVSRILEGVFPESAGCIAHERFAFAHLDCDQYRSVREASEWLQSRMVKGGTIWFDDSPCLAGARQAVQEVFGPRVQMSPEGKHYVVF